MQKYRAENIVQRIIENKQQTITNKYKHNRKHVKIELSKKNQVKYSFIESSKGISYSLSSSKL